VPDQSHEQALAAELRDPKRRTMGQGGHPLYFLHDGTVANFLAAYPETVVVDPTPADPVEVLPAEDSPDSIQGL
jgi:hypothetical protein